jgi:hypothetical protein
MASGNEQIDNYKKIRDEYQTMRDTLKSRIEEHNVEIRGRKQSISKLEEEICKARPTIEGAKRLCKPCDIISMKFTGMVPGQGEREFWYECVLCGHKDYHT